MRQTIIAEHNDGSDRFRLGIVIEPVAEVPGFDPVAAIKAASAEFCALPRGREAVEDNNGSFNYGDFVNEVPDTICRKHGFTVVDTFVTELIVDHNEQLIDPCETD